MITVDRDIKKQYPKAFSAARKERFRVVWLRDDLIYCARTAKGHGDYLVKVIATPSINGGHQVKMQCRTTNGDECNGVYWGKGCCAHIAAVLLRTEKKPDKKKPRRPLNPQTQKGRNLTNEETNTYSTHIVRPVNRGGITKPYAGRRV